MMNVVLWIMMYFFGVVTGCVLTCTVRIDRVNRNKWRNLKDDTEEIER